MNVSNSRLNSVKILENSSYPLPQVHNTIGHNVVRMNSKLGLGINERTGRLQWCPGVTCCKFLIILPVIMLPVTLVLVLIMRMDSVLMAFNIQQQQNFQQQQQQQQNQQHQHQNFIKEQQRYPDQTSYIDDYDLNFADTIEDIVSEQFILPYEPHQQSEMERSKLLEMERIKRCILFKFGQSETMDSENRDILKYARTSFLPQDTTIIPRECFDNRIGRNVDIDSYMLELLRKRSRRAPDADATAGAADAINNNEDETNENDETDTSNDAIKTDDYASYIETTSALQSYWNKHGTKDSIRRAQAHAMQKYMDKSVNPCNDFYNYACGNWEKLHPIPKDKAGYDTFEMLRENLDIVLKQLLESKELENLNVDKNGHKIPTIDTNNFDANNIVAQFLAGNTPDTSKIIDESKEVKAARLRQHIISRRAALSRLLNRYRRQDTSTKRKRLISQLTNQINNKNQNTQSKPHIVDARIKAKQLYQSCINVDLLQKRGVEPLLHLVKEFGGWPVLDSNWNSEKFDWLNLTAELRRYNNDIFIVEWVGPDIKNSDENVIQFDQTSLGLPTREYFLQDTNSKYLQAYQAFMMEVMHKLGASKDMATKTASELIAFETKLATITAPAENRLNVTNLYKRMTLRELQNTIPKIDWIRYLTILQERKVQDNEQVVIYAINYMKELVRLIEDTKPELVSNYLLWRFVRHRINNVDDRFENSKQSFYHTLFGREESPSRWKVCIAQVNTNMGMALGAMFVTKYFDEQSKLDTLKMTHELQQAFRDILKTTNWLDTETKYLAELKVNAMSLKIGYPDFILNPDELNVKYAGIDIHPDRYFENTLNVLLHTSKTEQNKLFEPVNKTTWQTAPAIVNAYYSRNKNQIMFPAGILQPPFYHRHFPRSMNFGGIGVVIGHELTHGFDDKGRLFDRNGSIHKWWSDTSIKGFDERAKCIIAQYSNYTVGEVGISLNGESTQGENIADNGGIRQAFHAYKRWLRDNPGAANDERLPGLDMTGEQLFFLNFGQVWCGAMRPEAVRNKLNTAIHSPGRFRVIGTLSNSPDFAREFHCAPGTPMNPVNKCSVW